MKSNKLIIGLFLMLVVLLSCQTNGDNTVVQNYLCLPLNSDLNANVTCAHFVNDKIGYASSSDIIYKTVDGGLTWKTKKNNELPIHAIYFVDDKVGFAVGGAVTANGVPVRGSIIYKTIDGGDTWDKKVFLKSSELNSVCFIDNNIGFATGMGLHVKTIDGGTTWTEFDYVPGFLGLIRKMIFIDSQIGFAVGTEGTIFKTTDQGKHWIKSANESTGHIYSISFSAANPLVGYAAATGRMIKTIDGGLTWKKIPVSTNAPMNMNFVHFSDENKGIAIGEGETTTTGWTNSIYSTLDGGATWKKSESLNIYSIVHFPTNKLGYSVMQKLTYKIVLQ